MSDYTKLKTKIHFTYINTEMKHNVQLHNVNEQIFASIKTRTECPSRDFSITKFNTTVSLNCNVLNYNKNCCTTVYTNETPTVHNFAHLNNLYTDVYCTCVLVHLCTNTPLVCVVLCMHYALYQPTAKYNCIDTLKIIRTNHTAV